MKIKEALIIHGPGRSGTTLLVNILALHPDIGWLSSYVDKFPKYPILNIFNKINDFRILEEITRNRRKFPRPSEAYNFWLTHIPEFNNYNLPSISENSAKKAQQYLSAAKRVTNKKVFMTKLTGYSRHQSLEAVFDSPKIVWIDRDPLAVIASYYKQRWGYKDKPEEFKRTDKIELIKHYTLKYNKFQMDKANLNKFSLLDLQYNDLVSNRHGAMQKICDFVEIAYPDNFKKIVTDWEIVSGTNSAYKKTFTTEEISLIESHLL